MKNLLKKIKSRTGETLIETLAAILVAALSAAALSMGIMTNTKSETKITEYQAEVEHQVSEAEIGAGTEPASLRLYFADKDGFEIIYDDPLTPEEEKSPFYEQTYSVLITGGENKITSFRIETEEEAGE